ncbi:major facilitator superfamily domain-containing protein [Hyaloraphidium curvatum]|nr:major facilitator superfamily domain-containing protein [Hyaloraphidium curvatum]
MQELDQAVFTKAHIRAIVVAGTGFLTDSYDNFVIGLMVPMIAYSYLGPSSGGALSSVADGFVKAASSYGNLVGQLGFGMLGDVLGRKKVYGVELMILVLGALCTAMVGTTASGGFTAFLVILAWWRFVLGVGVGGDYPVSAVITSEFASVQRRGAMIATVFAMQGFGILLGSIVAVITLAAAKNNINENLAYMDVCWRILAAFGIVPCSAAIYFRLTIPETPRFSADVLGDEKTAADDAKRFLGESADAGKEVTVQQGGRRMSVIVEEKVDYRRRPQYKYFGELREYLSIRQNWMTLLGTSMTWFLLDIGFYGTNLNTSVVLSAIGFADSSTPFNDVWSRAVGSCIIALAGNVPGYWFTVAFVDRWGRKPIQYMGFGMLVVCFAILAGAYYQMKANATWAFVMVYAFAQFFFNFGPNSTTFIIPAECFPTRVRSTCHGISAASGKLGAILAAQCFSLLANIGGKNAWMPNLLWIFTACMALGGVFTYLVPETKGKTLEELGGDDPLLMDEGLHSGKAFPEMAEEELKKEAAQVEEQLRNV